MKKIFICLFLISCGPKPVFVTEQGLNVYCEEAVCFSKEHFDVSTEILISNLIQKDPKNYSYDKIHNMLESEDQWHDIYVKEKKIGSIGSCPSSTDPNRRCEGFECGKSSKSGWCFGLTKNKTVYDVKYYEIYFAKFYECFAGNAYLHEMIHFFQEKMTGFRDYDHATEPLWSSACTEEKYPDVG
ncbi:MAG: hypothetical protein AABY22_13605, partial [Nanoarchaeota archaeon]